ncbi:MAG: cupin fold metalloprotein, WbuC family, partial [Planctomycetia bacterium]|nr:cupin fold metalloprotein, WbuC family [Planctomycetia bacterium]
TRFVRLAPQVFHTLIVRSEYLMFHETTRGPFRREDTVFADWAPAESEADLARQYVTELDQSISERGKS